MSDDDAAADLEGPPKKPGPKVRGKGGKGWNHAKRKEMAAFVVELRRDNSMMRYDEINHRVREKFECGYSVAERAMTEAMDTLREDFWRISADVPRMVVDGYMAIYDEAMREKNWGQARKCLDSVRDMFGIRGAVNVNLNVRTGADVAALDAYENLSDDQLEALAQLDTVAGAIDAASTEMPDTADLPSYVAEVLADAEQALDVASDVAAAGDDVMDFER